MRVLSLLTFVLLGAGAAAGQTAVRSDAPTGVTVIKYNWHNATRTAGWDSPTLSASEQSVENPLAGVAPLPDRNQNAVQPPGVTPNRQPRDTTRERRTKRPEATDSVPTDTGRDRFRRVEEYAYEVRIKNEAAETIEAVEWDYVFIEPVWGTELARHRFHTFRRAKPGKSLTLTGNSAAPPTRVISAAGQPDGGGKRKLFEERIVIKCVVYADGTVRWRDKGAESDCQGIRARAQSKKEGGR